MASATLNYGFPYPIDSDVVNIPVNLANLAIDIDSELALFSASVQSKASLSGAVFTGDIYGVSASFSGNVSSIEPSLSTHLTTKNYVDTLLVSTSVTDALYISDNYILGLTDSGGVVVSTAASAITVTIPLESSVDFSIGTIIKVVTTETGTVTISTSASLVSNKAGNELDSQYTSVSLYKVASDSWAAIFDDTGGYLKSNSQSASYTLAASDLNKIIEVTAASSASIIVPPNSSTELKNGFSVDIIQIGTGAVTIVPGSGVTLQSKDGFLTLSGQYAAASLYKRSTDTWAVIGDLIS